MSAALLDLARELLASNGIVAHSVALAGQGREHHLFQILTEDGVVCLLKVARADRVLDPRWPSRTAAEALRTERAAVALVLRVPVPHPVQILEGEPAAAILPLLPGTPPQQVYDRGALDEALLANISFQLGEALARIHTVRCPEDPGEIPLLAGAEPRGAVLLHLDYHLGNSLGVVKLHGRWKLTGVVDWTRAAWGSPIEDMVVLGTSVFATNPWALRPFLEGYARGGELPALEPIQRRFAEELELRLVREAPPTASIRAAWERRIAEWE